MQDGTLSLPGYPDVTHARRGNALAPDCPTRQLLDRIGDKWSVLILTLLGQGERRFNALRRDIGGVSQKMLSQTLRSLERDGMVTRSVEATMPVTVTYAITDMGTELLDALHMMIDWAETHMPMVAACQQCYDARLATPD